METGSATHTRRVAIDHHDEVADVFESLYASRPDRFATAFHYGRHKVDVLLDAELKKLDPAARVLDVGCGTGAYVARIRELGFEVIGMEPAPAMRARAREHNPRSTIVDGVVTSLPFESESFDFVLAIEVLRYLHRADVVAGTQEILRVLRPGGAAFITYVNRFALDGFYFLQRGRQILRRRRYDNAHPHCEFTTPGAVRHDLLAAGASHVELYGRLFGPIRIAYKAHERLGERVAKVAEPYDDLLCRSAWAMPFAGHLIAVAHRAAR